MNKMKPQQRAALFACASVLALAIAAAPYGIDPQTAFPTTKSAEAKGVGGPGSGGGPGGGNGGGNGNGASASSGAGNGNGPGSSNGQGTGTGNGHGNPSAATGHPSTLGSLNAANASPTAMDHASPNSVVGQIADYMDAITGTDETAPTITSIEEAVEALAAISNQEVDVDVANAVNDMLSQDDPDFAEAVESLASEADTDG